MVLFITNEPREALLKNSRSKNYPDCNYFCVSLLTVKFAATHWQLQVQRWRSAANIEFEPRCVGRSGCSPTGRRRP